VRGVAASLYCSAAVVACHSDAQAELGSFACLLSLHGDSALALRALGGTGALPGSSCPVVRTARAFAALQLV